MRQGCSSLIAAQAMAFVVIRTPIGCMNSGVNLGETHGVSRELSTESVDFPAKVELKWRKK